MIWSSRSRHWAREWLSTPYVWLCAHRKPLCKEVTPVFLYVSHLFNALVCYWHKWTVADETWYTSWRYAWTMSGVTKRWSQLVGKGFKSLRVTSCLFPLRLINHQHHQPMLETQLKPMVVQTCAAHASLEVSMMTSDACLKCHKNFSTPTAERDQHTNHCESSNAKCNVWSAKKRAWLFPHMVCTRKFAAATCYILQNYIETQHHCLKGNALPKLFFLVKATCWNGCCGTFAHLGYPQCVIFVIWIVSRNPTCLWMDPCCKLTTHQQETTLSSPRTPIRPYNRYPIMTHRSLRKAQVRTNGAHAREQPPREAHLSLGNKRVQPVDL